MEHFANTLKRYELCLECKQPVQVGVKTVDSVLEHSSTCSVGQKIEEELQMKFGSTQVEIPLPK
jgi:hypothetical protein